MHGAGNAATPLGAASIGAGPLLVRTDVKESAVGATDRIAHVVPAGDELFVHTGSEGCLEGSGYSGGDRPAFDQPLVPAAIQHLDLGVTVVIERPPETRRVKPAKPVIGNDQCVIANTQRSHGLGELLRAHDVERPLFFFQVMMPAKGDRAGNVRAAVGVAVIAVHDADGRVLQMRCQPLSVGQHLRPGIALVCHDRISLLG